MTELDKYLDAYVNDEKKITASPFLYSRITANLNAGNTHKRITLWQSLAVAASIAAVVIFGFFIGNSYNDYSSKMNNILINDNIIEKFTILTNYVDE